MKRDLEQLSKRVYDVLIIGGGIYGVCVAWDAVLRGLSVALVEKSDFGHATSFNTLRLIHGGLRYLQHMDIGRMLLSNRERRVWTHIAPHLVHVLPFLVPTYKQVMKSKPILSIALSINDLIGFDRNRFDDPIKQIPKGRIVSRDECLRLFPDVPNRDLTGGAIFYDCQIPNSERLIIALARSASNLGSDLANYVEVEGFIKQGMRIIGVNAKDVLTGDKLDILAKVVVNTSGPWFSKVLGLINGYRPILEPLRSKAFNVLIKRRLVHEYAVGLYIKEESKDRRVFVPKGNRLLFITPARDCSLIGTEHLPYDSDPDSCKVNEDEIQNFLDKINVAYPAANLRRQDVCFVYSGLLPMYGNEHKVQDVQLVRQYKVHDHRKQEGIEGLISVAGVKFTEARYVAEKVVDLIFNKLGRTHPISISAETHVHGGQIDRFNDFLDEETRKRSPILSREDMEHLIYNYGSAYREILKYLDKNPEVERMDARTSEVMRAEVIHGIRDEMAQKLSDIVLRRTGYGMAGSPGNDCLNTCVEVMANELNWTRERVDQEIDEVREIFST